MTPAERLQWSLAAVWFFVGVVGWCLIHPRWERGPRALVRFSWGAGLVVLAGFAGCVLRLVLAGDPAPVLP